MSDLIDRQAAIDSFWELDVEIRPSAINAIIDMIRTLPPAETPKRTGKSAQNVPNDDLIFRKAAIKAVDATWWNARGIRKTIQELPYAQPELIEKTAYIRGFEQGRTQGMIDTKAEEVAQPTADVVEVVRCKDCVYRPCLIMPHSSDFDYCSYGERGKYEKNN